MKCDDNIKMVEIVKVMKVVRSCVTLQQLQVARKMAIRFMNSYGSIAINQILHQEIKLRERFIRLLSPVSSVFPKALATAQGESNENI